jgi:methylmalonyl-CoA epimerase
VNIDHIGIAVKSLEQAIKVYEAAIGLQVTGFDHVEDQGVRVAMIAVGESRIELVEATRADSAIEKFISKRGEGIHHIALRVSNIDETLQRLKSSGVRLVDSTPKPGAHNTRVAFIHPSSTNGVLLELVEHGE